MPLLRLLVGLGLLLGAAAWSGCASTETQNDPNRVSNIPWNRPQRWESQGPMGGMMPGSQ